MHVSQCGFEPYERDDGLHPTGRPRPNYDAYLRDKGYEADNPWEHWANSGAAEDGALQNGWLLVHADKAARVPEEHSETPYMTRRAMDFIAEAEQDGRPWCLHLSYIKPHWPYIAPEPYASMYGPADVQPVIRSRSERQNAHPVFGAYMDMRYSRNMSRDEAREKVIPTYMGLIKQIDDQMGVLMRFLEAARPARHHHDRVHLRPRRLSRRPLDGREGPVPRSVRKNPADRHRSVDGRRRTRGTVCDALVEAIDLAPTFIEYFGGKPPEHILEGRSLMPLLHGEMPADWRKVVFSEYDYSMQDVRLKLNQPIEQCRLFMVFDGRWKYVHASGFRPMLYDLQRIRRSFSTAATIPPAPMSSRGCRRRCSTGRCIRRATSPPATRRSPAMRTTSFRSKAAS